jgi:hypothetical protein
MDSGAVACQVKGDTVHIEKSLTKKLGNFKKAGMRWSEVALSTK